MTAANDPRIDLVIMPSGMQYLRSPAAPDRLFPVPSSCRGDSCPLADAINKFRLELRRDNAVLNNSD